MEFLTHVHIIISLSNSFILLPILFRDNKSNSPIVSTLWLEKRFWLWCSFWLPLICYSTFMCFWGDIDLIIKNQHFYYIMIIICLGNLIFDVPLNGEKCGLLDSVWRLRYWKYAHEEIILGEQSFPIGYLNC